MNARKRSVLVANSPLGDVGKFKRYNSISPSNKTHPVKVNRTFQNFHTATNRLQTINRYNMHAYSVQ